MQKPFLKAGDLFLESQKFAEAIDMYSQAGNAGKEKIQHAYYTKAETKNERINKTTLLRENLGSSATLGRDLAKIGDGGDEIITYDKHKLTFRMNNGWEKKDHIKIDQGKIQKLLLLK